VKLARLPANSNNPFVSLNVHVYALAVTVTYPLATGMSTLLVPFATGNPPPPALPVFPRGMLKSNMTLVELPTFTIVTFDPSAPVATFPT